MASHECLPGDKGDPGHEEIPGEEHEGLLISRAQEEKDETVCERHPIGGLFRKHGQQESEQGKAVKNKGTAGPLEEPCPENERKETEEGAEQPGLIRDDRDGFHVTGMDEEENRAGQGDRFVLRERGLPAEQDGEQGEEEQAVPHV